MTTFKFWGISIDLSVYQSIQLNGLKMLNVGVYSSTHTVVQVLIVRWLVASVLMPIVLVMLASFNCFFNHLLALFTTCCHQKPWKFQLSFLWRNNPLPVLYHKATHYNSKLKANMVKLIWSERGYRLSCQWVKGIAVNVQNRCVDD